MNLHLFDSGLSTAKVVETLERFEGFRAEVYWDSADPPLATMGIGVNLESNRQGNASYLRLVLDKVYGSTVIDIGGFIADFNAALNNSAFRPTAAQVKQNPSLYNGILQSALDGLVGQNLLPGQVFQPFQFANEGQARDVLTQILEGYTIAGATSSGTLSQLQDRLASRGISIAQNSNEGVALASLFYNSPVLLGAKLLDALSAESREESWYQIRYGSNGGSTRSQGIAREKKRGRESLRGSVRREAKRVEVGWT